MRMIVVMIVQIKRNVNNKRMLIDNTSYKQYMQELDAYDNWEEIQEYNRRWQRMELGTINEAIMEHQEAANDIGIDICSFTMYQAFYQQHKMKHGSYKKYIQTNKYNKKIDERDNHILCQMHQVLEFKHNYQRKEQKMYDQMA